MIVRRLLVPLAAAGLLAVPVPALAHDQLTGTEPEDGATVASVDEVRLTFSGDISDLGAQVAISGGDATGALIDGAPQIQGTTLVQGTQDLGPGTYDVVWRVTSEDGHPISGAFAFTVSGAATGNDEAGTDSGAQTSAPAEAAAGDAPGVTTVPPTADTATATTADEDAITPEPDPEGAPPWTYALGALAALAVIGSAVAWWARRPKN